MVVSDLSAQDDSIQTAVTPCCPQTSIPLLMACTANVKTVVANPIVYLTNLTHDILQTINALDSPPHPDVINNEVKDRPAELTCPVSTAGGCGDFVFVHCLALVCYRMSENEQASAPDESRGCADWICSEAEGMRWARSR